MDKTFKIAQVSAAHGIRGEVKLACYLANPKDLARYNPLVTKQGKEFRFTITGHTKDHVLVKFNAIADRNQAELLRGLEFFAEAEKRPALKKNEYYMEDLIGLAALSEKGEPLGKVTAIHNFGAGDIIELSDGTMLPFKSPFIGVIENGKVIVTMPEYLGEDEKEAE